MSKSALSTFNTGIRRVSKTHRNGFMDDLLTLPPFYVHFVKCLVVLRIYWHDGHLGHVTWFIHIYINSTFIEMLPIKFDSDWPSGCRVKDILIL